MAPFLQLAEKRIEEALAFLMRCELVTIENDTYQVLLPFLHIDNQSPEIYQHHRNLRLKAIEAFPWRTEDSLYFSALLTCAEKDVQKLRQKLLNALAEASTVIEQSESQTLLGINIDFYRP